MSMTTINTVVITLNLFNTMLGYLNGMDKGCHVELEKCLILGVKLIE